MLWDYQNLKAVKSACYCTDPDVSNVPIVQSSQATQSADFDISLASPDVLKMKEKFSASNIT